MAKRSFDPRSHGSTIRTDITTPTIKAFYDLTRVQSDGIFHLRLLEVTQVSLGSVCGNAATRTQPHPFRHVACACAGQACVAKNDKIKTRDLKEVIVPLLFGGVGERRGDRGMVVRGR